MRELEKILEEMKESSITVATSKEHYIHPQDGRFVEEVVLLDDIEKIIRKHMNDGWIPAEEKPTEDGFYVATMSGALVDQDGEWVDGDDIIAWRPLPDPYRPERSAKNA